MIPQHRELAAGRWSRMGLCEQMANIGSEVSRALNWRNKGNRALCEKASLRTLELIDLSLESTATYPRLREIARVREVFVDDFFGSNTYASSERSWRRYFDAFAVARSLGRN
ncbi:MAG: hypothetical protein HQL11_02470 [Candidatus Omnitrophica bacterium]|nr:hypothetical protein [Candidatus Omnitrophota bacterium]